MQMKSLANQNAHANSENQSSSKPLSPELLAKLQKPKITYNLDTLLSKDLHELENLLTAIEKSPKSPERSMRLRGLRASIIQRQHTIKAKAMEFEQDNDRHLLIFDSTNGYSKVAGNSVLFYTTNIAARINRRYNLKIDTDRYFKSEDGIVSLKLNDELTTQLANIHIYPDRFLSTKELHFFHLDKIYTRNQIETMRDQASSDSTKITSLILPKTPTPLLNDAVMQLNQSLFLACKQTSTTLAREIFLIPLLEKAHQMALYYVEYANSKSNKKSLQSIHKIYENTIYIKNSMSNLNNLHLIHSRKITKILASLIDIEHLSTKIYQELLSKNSTDKK